MFLRSFLVNVLTVATTAGTAAPATPQRPSFSSDPSTTVAGTFEIEAGYLVSDGDSADLPLLLKWGSGERTELFLGWSPYVRADDDVDGSGDTVVGVRHRFFTDERSALAYQLSGKVPTADDAIGSGVPDVTAALTSRRDIGAWTLVGYYQTGFLGRPGGDHAVVEHALAVAAARALVGNVSGYVEATGTWRPELDSTDTRWLAGLGYTPRPSVVIDVAVIFVAREGEDVVQGTVGVTVNLGS